MNKVPRRRLPRTKPGIVDSVVGDEVGELVGVQRGFFVAHMKKGAAMGALVTKLGLAYFTRFLYSPVAVSISILSPISTKAGT